MIPTALLLLLGAVAFSEAHIKLFYNPWQMPIRNAPGFTSDGTFSAQANQPCGGNQQWGRDNQNRYANVVDGQKVCARVNWNGGHSTTPNENKLKAWFKCGRPAAAETLLNNPQQLPLIDGTSPAPESNQMYVDAFSTNAVYDGYTLCVQLPTQGITATQGDSDARRCTLSITEGNTWGGCLDMYLYAAGVIPELTPAPVPSVQEYLIASSKPLALNYSEGTYMIKQCYTDSGGKCCLLGYFGVRNNGAVSARLIGSGDSKTCYDLSNNRVDYQTILKPSKFSADVYEGNMYLYLGYDEFGRYREVQNMSITLRDGGTMYFTNVGLDIPIVSDHDVSYFASLETGLNLGFIPWPNYSTVADNTPWNIIIPSIVCGIIIVYLLGGVLYSKATGGPCEHPHIHALLVQCGCVRRRRKKIVVDDYDLEKPVVAPPVSKPKSGFSLVLPPNWSSAIDPMSGEVYYYNTSTKEVRWERPT